MKNWLERTPRTMGDWLALAAGTALLLAAAGQLPGLLRTAAGLLALLAPFGWGLVLAYVLDIPTRFFAAKLFGGRRGGALAVSYALLFGVLALLAALVVPQLVQRLTAFAGRLGAYEETLRRLLAWVQATFGIDTATAGRLVQAAGRALQGWLAALSRTAAQSAAKAASGAAGAAADAFVTLAVSIYLLSGKAELLQAARCCLRAALPPGAAAGVFSVCRLANRIFSGYLGGQLVDALLVGGETFALMSIFGLEYAPLLAVLVGMTNIVPVLGPFLGAVPGIVILLLEAPWKAAEFAIIIFVVQQVDGNFIAPRILGGATGLPGLGVLLAIVVGGAWFGIPGMVLGLAFLFTFTGTPLQNTFPLMILCNIVHYFSTPYLMMKNSLSKMNAGWETTAMLMGDSWPKTILRVVTPNAASSLIEVFSYYFINSMVTISALIFLAGARTMVLTTKIKQLQYVNEYNEVFVLSLLILFTNLLAKAIFTWLANRSAQTGKRNNKKRKETKPSCI